MHEAWETVFSECSSADSFMFPVSLRAVVAVLEALNLEFNTELTFATPH